MLLKNQKIQTNLYQFCNSLEGSPLQTASHPKQHLFLSAACFEWAIPISTSFFPCYACPCGGGGGKTQKRAVSAISGVTYPSCLSATQPDRVRYSSCFVNANPVGRSLTAFLSRGLLPLENLQILTTDLYQSRSLSHPMLLRLPSALLQSTQPWTDLQTSSWRGYFSHHSSSEHHRFFIQISACATRSSLCPIRLKAALLRIRTSAIAPAEKQEDCDSETLVSQGLLLQ